MQDREYIANLIAVVEELKHRVLKECEVVEHISGDELFKEKALLRNLAMHRWAYPIAQIDALMRTGAKLLIPALGTTSVVLRCSFIEPPLATPQQR